MWADPFDILTSGSSAAKVTVVRPQAVHLDNMGDFVQYSCLGLCTEAFVGGVKDERQNDIRVVSGAKARLQQFMQITSVQQTQFVEH